MTASLESCLPRRLLITALIVAVGCEDAVTPDAGTSTDAAVLDAAPPDASASADAGPPDIGPSTDAGQTECGDGIVEGDEACDPGRDGCCEADCSGPIAADTVCRPTAGPCDRAETCDGTAVTCPADQFAPPSITCRAGNGPCDLPEACDGASPACPVDTVASSTVTCRGAAGACDVPETCDGVATTCPADQLAVLGAACRPAVGDCDVPETCDGLLVDCPADNLAMDATPCTSCPTTTPSCGGCYGGSCLDAQALCADILASGMSVGDGVYTLAPNVVTSTGSVRTVPAYCDMTTRGGGWTLIYKKSPLMPGNAGAMFTGTPTRTQDLSVLGRFPSPDYVSDFHVSAWSAFAEIRVEILTGTVATKFIDFDAIGSTPTGWFAADRHTASSWTDLPTSPNWEGTVEGQFFSINPGGARKFYVNRTWGGCPADRGWLMISSGNFCPWQQRTSQPNEILYALGSTDCRFDDAAQVGYGDAFLVWAR